MQDHDRVRRPLYTPWPPHARRSWGWAAIALVVVFYAAATLLYVVGQMSWLIATRGPGLLQNEVALTAALSALPPPGVLFALLFVLFASWGGLTLAWMAGFERRGLPSIGMQGERAGRQFFGGLVWAAVSVFLLGLAVFLIGLFFPVDMGEAIETAQWSRLADPGLWLIFAAIAVFFLIQGGIEEVIFRGWLMSTLAARWGRTAAVVASSLAFALFHVHVFMTGWANGLAAMLGITMTGLFLAVYALRQGSIWGVIGLHGGFNAIVYLSPVLHALASQPDTPAGQVISEVFQSATGMTGTPDFQPQALAQALVFGILAALFVMRLRKSRR